MLCASFHGGQAFREKAGTTPVLLPGKAGTTPHFPFGKKGSRPGFSSGELSLFFPFAKR